MLALKFMPSLTAGTSPMTMNSEGDLTLLSLTSHGDGGCPGRDSTSPPAPKHGPLRTPPKPQSFQPYEKREVLRTELVFSKPVDGSIMETRVGFSPRS